MAPITLRRDKKSLWNEQSKMGTENKNSSLKISWN